MTSFLSNVKMLCCALQTVQKYVRIKRDNLKGPGCRDEVGYQSNTLRSSMLPDITGRTRVRRDK